MSNDPEDIRLDPILEHEDDRGPGDHHSLSRAEMEVFNIFPELRGKLANAYLRYECFIGLVAGAGEEFDRQADWDRRRFPEYLPEIHDGIVFDAAEAAKFTCRSAVTNVASPSSDTARA